MRGGSPTSPEAREALERELRDAHEAGRFAETATRLVRGYGPEVLGFLAATLRDEQDAHEVFARVCEDAWRGLPGFRRACSFRTWIYGLARNAAHTFRNEPARRRRAPLSELPEVLEAQQHVHATTELHLRTDVKDRVARLRERLEPEDRELLVLRIDRNMTWNEIALVVGDAASHEELARRAALLRKRFERVKERLRKLVAEAS